VAGDQQTGAMDHRLSGEVTAEGGHPDRIVRVVGEVAAGAEVGADAVVVGAVVADELRPSLVLRRWWAEDISAEVAVSTGLRPKRRNIRAAGKVSIRTRDSGLR
jgi:hypothetical protein